MKRCIKLLASYCGNYISCHVHKSMKYRVTQITAVSKIYIQKIKRKKKTYVLSNILNEIKSTRKVIFTHKNQFCSFFIWNRSLEEGQNAFSMSLFYEKKLLWKKAIVYLSCIVTFLLSKL